MTTFIAMPRPSANTQPSTSLRLISLPDDTSLRNWDWVTPSKAGIYCAIGTGLRRCEEVDGTIRDKPGHERRLNRLSAFRAPVERPKADGSIDYWFIIG